MKAKTRKRWLVTSILIQVFEWNSGEKQSVWWLEVEQSSSEKLPGVIFWKWVEQIQPLKASDASNNHFNDSRAAFQHSMGTKYKNN